MEETVSPSKKIKADVSSPGMDCSSLSMITSVTPPLH